MMSNNREDYGSASEWLSALRQDGLWRSQLQQLKDLKDGGDALRAAALRKIGQGDTFELWDSYGHQVEPVVTEVWGIAELSLIKLKIQTIGMLSIEWLEHGSGGQSLDTDEQQSAIVKQLKPIFYGSEKEAEAFLQSIQGMKPKQITDRVSQLVMEKKISDLSKHRDLWKVLHDNGLYDKTESNWNMQVR